MNDHEILVKFDPMHAKYSLCMFCSAGWDVLWGINKKNQSACSLIFSPFSAYLPPPPPPPPPMEMHI